MLGVGSPASQVLAALQTGLRALDEENKLPWIVDPDTDITLDRESHNAMCTHSIGSRLGRLWGKLIFKNIEVHVNDYWLKFATAKCAWNCNSTCFICAQYITCAEDNLCANVECFVILLECATAMAEIACLLDG